MRREKPGALFPGMEQLTYGEYAEILKAIGRSHQANITRDNLLDVAAAINLQEVGGPSTPTTERENNERQDHTPGTQDFTAHADHAGINDGDDGAEDNG